MARKKSAAMSMTAFTGIVVILLVNSLAYAQGTQPTATDEVPAREAEIIKLDELVVPTAEAPREAEIITLDELNVPTVDATEDISFAIADYLSQGDAAYFTLHNYAIAISAYTSVLQLDPDNVYALTWRGHAHKDSGEQDLAIADFNRAIELDPNASNAYHGRGLSYSILGDEDQALADFNRTIELVPDAWYAYGNRATIYRNEGDYAQSMADIERALQINPEYSDGYANRAYVNFLRGDYKLAIIDYGQAIVLGTGNVNLANIYRYRAQAYEALDDFESAISDYTSVLELAPSDAVTYYNRAMANMTSAQFDSAIQDFNSAIELDPDYANAYIDRAIMYIFIYGEEGRRQAAPDIVMWLNLNEVQRIEAPAPVTGESYTFIMEEGVVHALSFEGQAGQLLSVEANAALNSTSTADPVIVLISPGGEPLVGDDDDFGDDIYNAAIRNYPLPQDGKYTLLVGHSYAGSYGEVKVKFLP